MPCLVACFALISPRLAIVLLWLFTDRMTIAFDSFWIWLVGLVFLPWTTLAWAAVYVPFNGIEGFGWFIVAIGFIIDISTYIGSARSRSAQRA